VGEVPTTVTAIAAAVRSGEVRAVEVVQAALDRIRDADPRLNAVVASDPAAALSQAALLDARRPDERGALAGVPILVKDVEDASGYRTTYGSLLHASDPPATRDSTVVARLKAAGCIVVGKANTPEHAYTATTDNRVFGPTANPWSFDHGVGGSSGGSAAAVAAGLVPLATASDGGGSIRIPAAVNGLPGIKPTLGLVPHGDPDAPDWGDLSSRGVLAADIAGTIAALDVITGQDPHDLRTFPRTVVSFADAVAPRLPPTIAWSRDLGYAAVDDEIARVARAAAEEVAGSLGARLVDVDAVFDSDPISAWLPLAMGLTRRLIPESRFGDLDPGLAFLLDAFGQGSAQDLARAVDAAHELNLVAHQRVFRTHALLLTPTVAGQTPRLGAQGTVNGEEAANWVALTYPWNLTRQPAASVPAGLSAAGLPIGLQIIGRRFDDLAVLDAMAAAEAALGPWTLPARA
jgi:Asp-tRNA(Asn)/Glu-tRNA(Gln) amidotransferase A subunit family amidase